MSAAEPMSHPSPSPAGPCPSDEELGAFIEGTLAPSDRARVISHVVRCESCYEVLAGVLAFESAERAEPETESPEEEGDDDEELPQAAVLPFPQPSRTQPPPRRTGWALPLAAALLVGAAGGWLLDRMMQGPSAGTAAEFVADLEPPDAAIAAELWASRKREAYRGPNDEGPRPGGLTSSYVLLGAYWVDLRLSAFAADPRGIARQASQRILEQGSGLGLPEPVTDRLAKLAAEGSAAPQPEELDALEDTMQRELDPNARPLYGLGACLQALRFASDTRQPRALAADTELRQCVSRYREELIAALDDGTEGPGGPRERASELERSLEAEALDLPRLGLELAAIFRQLEARALTSS